MGSQNSRGNRGPNGRDIKNEAKGRLRWSHLLTRAEAGEHPSRAELAQAIRQFGVSDYASEYVADRLEDKPRLKDGRPSKRSARLWVELRERDALAGRIEKWTRRYARVRLSDPRNCPREMRRKARARLLERDGRDWTKTKDGQWKLRAPQEVALRRESRDCAGAQDLAKALDASDGEAARRARVKWDEHADQLKSRLKEWKRNRPKHEEELTRLLTLEAEAARNTPPA